MTFDEDSEALPFHEDFAARVLLAADRARVRQRRIHWAASAATASVAIALVVAAPWRGAPSISPVRPAPPQVVARAEPVTTSTASTAGDTQTEPLVYMFPDAEPLSQFSAQYVNATAEQDSDIFSDDTEEAGGS